MSTITTSPAFTLITIITTEFEKLQEECLRTSQTYKNIQKLIKDNCNILATPTLLENKKTIHLLQVLMLTSLSFYGGVNTPPIKQCQRHNNTLKLIWDTGDSHSFTFEKIDPEFIRFSTYFSLRLSKHKNIKKGLPSQIFRGIYQYINAYYGILEECKKQFETLLKNSQNIITFFSKNQLPELLLLFCSCLPKESLNQLLLHIQQFIPDNTMIRTPTGNTIQATSLLGKPSTNTTNLFEKCHIILQLYLDLNQKAEDLNQNNINAFLSKLMQNKINKLKTTQNINEIITYQITPRLTLYKFVITWLTPLVEHEKNIS